MNDKRDLPFIHLLTAIHILVIPLAIILYTPTTEGLVLVAGLYSLFLYFPDVFQRAVRTDAALYQSPQTV